MPAYYNENDSFAAAWLRNLIVAGHICRGEVDERSIEDVKPTDLRGFEQHHFFAGIGVWSYVLKRAGWPDEKPVWTGSCPCQPFSAAGKRGGFSDKRHLWPAWFRLIRECHPDTVFGEQVASKGGLAWFDVVSADLEGEGYTIGAADTCAAGFGAPHIRQRLYFVAESERAAVNGECRELPCAEGAQPRRSNNRLRGSVQAGGMADTPRLGHERSGGTWRGREGLAHHGGAGIVGDPSVQGLPQRSGPENGRGTVRQEGQTITAPSLTNGFWRDAEWLWCRDKKYRPIPRATESGIQQMADGTAAGLGLVRLERRAQGEVTGEEVIVLAPLVAGSKNRVGRLRGYGNCIVAPQAEEFVRAYMQVRP